MTRRALPFASRTRVGPLLSLVAAAVLPGCAVLQEGLAQGSSTHGSLTQGTAAGASGTEQERDLYLDLIAGLQEKGLDRASLAHLDEYDQRFPATPRSIRLRAEAFTSLDMQSAAVTTWERLLGTTDEGAARNGLGRVAAGTNRWDVAAQHFLGAVTKQPTNPRYLNNLGYALLRSGDRAGAEFRLRQAEELDGDSGEIRRNVILALFASGKPDEADGRLSRIQDASERATLRREAQRVAATLPTGAARPVAAGSAAVAEVRS